MRRRLTLVALAVYAAMAIVTFGNSAAGQQAHCKPTVDCTPDFATFYGLFAGMFWPLYWAWELQA